MDAKSEKRGQATSRGISSPLKWHSSGGKGYLASRIVELMPPRCQKPNAPEPTDPGWLHYCEPFAGGLSVLLANDPEGISEVANDLNGVLSSFWACMAHQGWFAEFHQRVESIPFSESVWKMALKAVNEGCDCGKPICVAMATAFFVCCRQSLAGRMKSFAPLSRNRTRRGMNEQAAAWLTCLEGLPEVHQRLRGVVILNHDATDVIREQDGPRTLFYLDPPYVHQTRASTGEYAHEMTDVQHFDLLSLLATLKGRFLLSGYPSKMYDDFAAKHGWKRHDFDIANHAASGSEKRRMTESVYTNY